MSARDGYTVVDIPVALEHGDGIGRVVLDADRQVAGFFVRPTENTPQIAVIHASFASGKRRLPDTSDSRIVRPKVATIISPNVSTPQVLASPTDTVSAGTSAPAVKASTSRAPVARSA